MIRGGRGGRGRGRKIISFRVPWEGMKSRGWRQGGGGYRWGPDEDNGWRDGQVERRRSGEWDVELV